MTEVTDKMVDTAWDVWRGPRTVSRKDVRNMIEAALAAREPAYVGELVNKLRHNMGNTVLSLIQERDQAADTIEELVEALRIISAIDNKVFWEDWEKVEESVRIAKSALAKA